MAYTPTQNVYKEEERRSEGSREFGGPEGECSISEGKRGIEGSSGAPRKGKGDFLRFQKEQILYFTGRRIAGHPGRMEEIFEVLKQRTA